MNPNCDMKQVRSASLWPVLTIVPHVMFAPTLFMTTKKLFSLEILHFALTHIRKPSIPMEIYMKHGNYFQYSNFFTQSERLSANVRID